ncbi:Zn-dependent hydrolase [Guptibacillus hwajinpoensis]|uniref:Allantoate deiminase n=1 Tax=Guptibacillus hwajinpoensis TaxID=208199 RepID=A0ABU0K3U6_9BACL|nr:Zn-dependent hydrolase [Alkalihalobacillus hemicentroti]MDQ0484040.1 allantoate deiminase [Alkalihalobacillus hemicentroti]
MGFAPHHAMNLEEELLRTYAQEKRVSGVDGRRLALRFSAISQIGRTEDGGSRRIGFTREEQIAKEAVTEWMKEAGLEITMDGAGNVFGKIEGTESDAIIQSGSHVDTVPNGGHFDGVLGVLAAIEVAQAWKDTGYRPRHTFEVAVFSDEEGARFHSGVTGSRAMAGELNRDVQRELKDEHGRSFENVLEDNNLSLDRFVEAKRDLTAYKAFVEVHIEQGKQLEKNDLPYGIVSGIAGPCWLEVTFKGEAGHAGNTPMNDRSDALVAASSFVTEVSKLPEQVSETSVATIGKMIVSPGGVNVIPGEVKVTVDIRDIDETHRDELVTLVQQAAEKAAASQRVELEMVESIRVKPVPVDPDLYLLAGAAMEKASGHAPFYLASGAGHDAMIIGKQVPMIMFFTRSRRGISHSPLEWSSLEDCVETIEALKAFIEEVDQKES